MARNGYEGSGPGEFTPDGCSVDLYLRLPVGTEPEVIQRSVPAGASILELGSGVGRVTKPLVELGFAVTAVDESAAMLDYVRYARTVRSPIESLRLDELFDVVLLSSYLVHAPDPQLRRSLLVTCARHVKPGGQVLIQREGSDWHDNVPMESSIADATVRVISSEPAGDGVRSVLVEYEFPEARWTHRFRSRPLTDTEFTALLGSAGLALDEYLTPDRTWVRARLGE